MSQQGCLVSLRSVVILLLLSMFLAGALEAARSQTYFIISAHSGKCLDAAGT